ncbi:hypothetical protein [Caballeronia sp. Sq4a]|uniref:hypothetical protein n=1 Tax=Caballeronia sp. Sq4a TaxID=2878152 RepID=UPI0020BEE2AC|nr:hypothetical protein [Caballeronia sp. Sq4a]
MSTKHTPGPWTVNPRGDEGESNLVFANTLANGSRQLVASVAVGADAPANRRLIAAAPDLLAVLERASHINGFREFNDYLPTIRAAIAKATGEKE